MVSARNQSYLIQPMEETVFLTIIPRNVLICVLNFILAGNALIAPSPASYAAPFNQFGPSTPPLRAAPPIYQPPPQIFYWGYPNGPMSPTTTYFGPLQIPPHAFTHFDRPTLVS